MGFSFDFTHLEQDMLTQAERDAYADNFDFEDIAKDDGAQRLWAAGEHASLRVLETFLTIANSLGHPVLWPEGTSLDTLFADDSNRHRLVLAGATSRIVAVANGEPNPALFGHRTMIEEFLQLATGIGATVHEPTPSNAPEEPCL